MVPSGWCNVAAAVAETKGNRSKSKKAAADIESVKILDVVADRFRVGTAEQVRAMEAIEAARARQRQADGLCAG